MSTFSCRGSLKCGFRAESKFVRGFSLEFLRRFIIEIKEKEKYQAEFCVQQNDNLELIEEKQDVKKIKQFYKLLKKKTKELGFVKAKGFLGKGLVNINNACLICYNCIIISC